MQTNKAEFTDRQEVLNLALALLRDAKEDCEVDCASMALSKIDQAIRLLAKARAKERRKQPRAPVGCQKHSFDNSLRQLAHIPLGLSEE
jgi:hypothetical protein